MLCQFRPGIKPSEIIQPTEIKVDHQDKIPASLWQLSNPVRSRRTGFTQRGEQYSTNTQSQPAERIWNAVNALEVPRTAEADYWKQGAHAIVEATAHHSFNHAGGRRNWQTFIQQRAEETVQVTEAWQVHQTDVLRQEPRHHRQREGSECEREAIQLRRQLEEAKNAQARFQASASEQIRDPT